MGGSEILLILFAILVLFGADKLPGFAKSLAKGLREIKKATDEIKEELTKNSNEIVEEFKEIKNQTTSGIEDIKHSADKIIESSTEPLKDIDKNINLNRPG